MKPASASPRSASCWRWGSFVSGPDSQLVYLPAPEKVWWRLSLHRAVMREPNRRPLHDEDRDGVRNRLREPPGDTERAGAARRPEDHADAGPEAAVARPLRQRTAAVQQALPRKPARLPHSGAGLRRPS